MKNSDWKDSVIDALKRIKSLKHTNPIGSFCSPEQYIQTLEEFTKMMYDINQVPPEAYANLMDMKIAFNNFKELLLNHCEILLKEADKNDQ